MSVLHIGGGVVVAGMRLDSTVSWWRCAATGCDGDGGEAGQLGVGSRNLRPGGWGKGAWQWQGGCGGVRLRDRGMGVGPDIML
eukprot:357568-Chlamydomonas_euryale.AAC.6